MPGEYLVLRWWDDDRGNPTPIDHKLAIDNLTFSADSFMIGDLNCDGSLNSLDIDPFVLALTSTPPDYLEYYAEHPDCDATLADTNTDGSINSLDIDPFVDLLTAP